MFFFLSTSHQPHYNLALEEYLLKNLTDDVIFLYRDAPSVIVGKHQNALAEINYRFLYENSIPLIRRISGGGTVYHDLGNLNFSFIQNGEEGNLVNFRKFIEPVAEFLGKLGVAATIGTRNDILVEGLKVSGNAEHVYKKRTLHHGTLLISAGLTNLRSSLKIVPGKYTDKAVKSVRSSVANLDGYIPKSCSVQEFQEQLAFFLVERFQADPLRLNDDFQTIIQRLMEEKYLLWEWNYGYSPTYQFSNVFSIEEYRFSVSFPVEKGVIQKADVSGNCDGELSGCIQNALQGSKHEFSSVFNRLNNVKFEGTSSFWKDFTWNLF